MRKILFRGSLVLYLAMLSWLVLFKLRFHISSVFHNHHRSLNLAPFAAPAIVNGKTDYNEIIFNCLFFIPFGLLLSVNFKKLSFLSKLSLVLAYSLTAEAIQYKFAIGATDITDVIMNTLGGFLGLILYNVSNKFIATKKLDSVIVSLGTVMFLLCISIYASHLFHRRLR